MGFDLKDYVEVKDRIADFKAQYPDGRLTSEIVSSGFDGFITVKAYAFRSPEDVQPGTGLAWEPVPGKTPYTKDSELQNAETSAWGRAIVAALIADASGGVASRDEVRNRQKVKKESPKPEGARWLADAVQIFKSWDEDARRAAYKQAMEVLDLEKLGSVKDAERVFQKMGAAYYEEFPSDETRPF